MREYLQHFRENPAFESTFKLYKRIMMPSFLLSILYFILSAIVFIPLFILTIGGSLNNFTQLQQDLKLATIDGQPSNSEMTAIMEKFMSNINMSMFVMIYILFLIIMLFYFFINYNLTNNEIKRNDNSIISAIKSSFSLKFFKFLSLSFVMILIFIASSILLSVVSGILVTTLGGFGTLLFFVLYFVFIFFLIRFSLSYNALVHGDLGIFDCIRFSLSKITFKKSIIIFFIMLLITLILAIVLFVLVLAVGNMLNSAIGSILFLSIYFIVISLLYSFYFSASSALYFRYSNDQIEDTESVKDHLVM